MCGICGIVGDSSPEQISCMVAAMHHRGPDDSGVFREDRIALAMARLAIIDVTPSGHQPMANAEKSIWIVYNGETYNFQEERQLLRAKGHSFVSSSDTEVVLRMYEVYGDDFLLRMRGMFALAIYDKRLGKGKERHLLARDHLGIKPLLYARVGARFIFASEMKALLASEYIVREFDPEALRLLLTFGSITQPRTAVKGVNMLLPGHKLVIEAGKERIERFWKLETNRIEGLHELQYEELVSCVRSALEESVRLHMVSDVPVGAFLSGGVDSSLLVALMSRITGHKVRTFSVGFEAEGAYLDETDDAQRVAAFLGTDHSRVVVTGQDVRSKIEHIASALDQPSVDGVNSYFVSAAARQGVTVAISGTGGDELFAGYPWFISMDVASAKDRQHTLRTAVRTLLAHTARQPFFDPLLISKLGPAIDKMRSLSGFLSVYARIYQIFGAARGARMLSPAMRQMTKVGQELALDLVLADELHAEPTLERVSALCLRGYTQNQLLRDIDAVSMSHSLEVRVPFLDPKLTDLALSLPLWAKLNDVSKLSNPLASTYRETGVKKILVDVGRGLLPDGLDLQVKRGFGMPFDSWLKGSLRDVFDDVMSPATLNRRGFFDTEEALSLKKNFLAGKQGWARPWLLMMIELWCREVFDKSSLPHGDHRKAT